MKSSSTASSEPGEAGEARALARYLAVLIVGAALALAVAEAMLRVWIVPIDDSRAHRVHLVYTASGSDVVLGDSHLYRAFLGSERFVDLARPGSSPAALEIVAREYFRHREPGRVIVQASPQLFNRTMQLRGAQQHDAWFTLNLGLPFVPYVFEPGIARELASFRDWGALRRRAAASRGRMRSEGPVVDREAAERRAMSPEELRSEARRRVRSNAPVPDFADSPAFAAYRRLLDFLVERGAAVCLAETPVSPEYREAARDEPGHGRVEAALRRLAAERGLAYVAFRDLRLALATDDFTNADHATTRAGAAYAQRLEDACYGDPAGEDAASSSTR